MNPSILRMLLQFRRIVDLKDAIKFAIRSRSVMIMSELLATLDTLFTPEFISSRFGKWFDVIRAGVFVLQIEKLYPDKLFYGIAY